MHKDTLTNWILNTCNLSVYVLIYICILARNKFLTNEIDNEKKNFTCFGYDGIAYVCACHIYKRSNESMQFNTLK